jgi:membrane peptidoglycan carboxypeptidase
VNYNGEFTGPVQMRFALGNSINVTAVKTLALVGIKNMLELGHDMGLTTLEPTTRNVNRFGLSVALGGGEVKLIDLTSAYSVFGAGGIRHEPVAILRVEDRNGKTLFKYRPSKGKQVLSTETAYLISHILSDNNARLDVFGPSSWLHIPGKTVAVKTGTTNDKRDNWTVGFTEQVAIGVWVGNNDNSKMNEKLASGVTGAAPIWNRVMREALQRYNDGIPEQPDTVITLDIDGLAGGLPRDGQPIRTEYFHEGTEPTSESDVYQSIRMSRKQEGKKASPDEVRVGEYDERNFIVWTEKDPISRDGRNRWQEGIKLWLEDHPDPMWKSPTETSDVKIEEEKEEEKKDEDDTGEEPTATPTPEESPEDPTETPTPTEEPSPTETPTP